ncbi:hypothetical protein CLAFUW4_03316 [Fulvia fulva]|uniref:Uncharacterized protein n=1 Tax=Passalora fulva TaxID=5499 RepID=A0A9Q8LBK9_PASFU|nr:uncharacterized protein CLAFUR5_03295 [Fulvia fulva]KAK4631005.1 hypothetical protein CLAFUR4_03305 [Fulvia fulva]KAK4633989.1 hypothetical protein CLAFUR0_03309 [Fulvia fulva]UJO14418.1 hypothetical protein CLAFUR5_03295 [Fulvia fulva]WPV10487.1 hypothetical protein CLAFUW4_03316 [Fulvia fulva]WPV26951.1 hypothetical protein CLAFUW7_03308 [Fulvia fulva]
MRSKVQHMTEKAPRVAKRTVTTVSEVVSTAVICNPAVVKDGARCPVGCTPEPMSVSGSDLGNTLSWQGWSSCLPLGIPAATATRDKAVTSITVTLPSSVTVSTTISLPAIDSETPLSQGPGPVIPNSFSTTTSSASSAESSLSTTPSSDNLAQSSTTNILSSTASTIPDPTNSSNESDVLGQHSKSFPQTGAGIATITILAVLVLAAIFAVLFWRRRRRRQRPAESPKLDGDSVELQHSIPPSLNTLPTALPEEYVQYIEDNQARRDRQEENRQKFIERVRRIKTEDEGSSHSSRLFGS